MSEAYEQLLANTRRCMEQWDRLTDRQKRTFVAAVTGFPKEFGIAMKMASEELPCGHQPNMRPDKGDSHADCWVPTS